DRGDVEQHAAGEEGAGVLDAELLEAVGVAELGELVAVVEDVLGADADADVAEAVELGADLADLAANQLVVVDDLVLAHRPAGRPARDGQAEMALARDRHILLGEPAELV